MAVKIARLISSICIVMILFGFGASLTHAKGPKTSSKEITVASNQTVDNFLVVGHNATIDGTVRNLVLVVGGDLHIHATAHVKELIIVIGGSVYQDAGTHVTENILAFAWNRRVWDAFLFGGAVLLSSWMAKLIIALFLILFSTIAGQIVPPSFKSQGLLGSWKLWLTGVITSLWLLVVILILGVTIVAIPVALVLLIIPIISFFIAGGAISREIGHRLSPNRQGEWMPTVLGAFVLTALLSFPLIGFFLYLALIVLSLGHLMLWIAEKWQNRKTKKPKDI